MFRFIKFISPASWGKYGICWRYRNTIRSLAKGLTKEGFEVSFITYGDGGEPIEYIDNIRVIKTYMRNDVPSLSLPVKSWHVWRALIKANSDIYLETLETGGIISLFCRLRRRKSILLILSERDVMKRLTALKLKFYLTLAHRLNIRLANSVVAQSESQKKMLSQNFRRESIIIKNPLPLHDDGMPAKHSSPIVFWVATIRLVKQAELFLELAKAIPEAKFQMIGGSALGEEQYFTSIQEAARHIPNLDFMGFIPRDRIGAYFDKASILVNASIFEGFPMTFLEAWASYTPVVSLNADPDEIICRYKLGCHSKNFQQMVNDVRILLKNKGLRDEMGRNGRKYVEQHHDIQKIIAQYVGLFHQLVDKV